MKRNLNVVREILRRKERGDSLSSISEDTNVAKSTIRDWLRKTQEHGITQHNIGDVTDEELNQALWSGKWSRESCLEPDYGDLLARTWSDNSSVRQAYLKYLASMPQGCSTVSLSTFYRNLKEHGSTMDPKDVSIINDFKPAQACMIDYSGDGVKWMDKKENKEKTARVFVGVLCYSRLIYCVATPGQTRRDWLHAISLMYEFFKGVTEEVWLDNSTSLVKKADKYDPVLSEEFVGFCSYHNTTGVAVAPGQPRHKALVENAVGLCQRKILAELSKRSFFSVESINKAIEPLLEKLNAMELSEFKGQSRMDRFNGERHLLRRLPLIRYSPGSRLLRRKVQKGNQVRIDGCRYSVPWGHVGKEILIQICSDSSIVYLDGDNGEEIGTSALREPGTGPEATRKDFVPDSIRHLVESVDELLERVSRELGEKAYRVAVCLAKPKNTNARRHLRGLLDIGRKREPQFMEKIYDAMLQKSYISFDGLKKTIHRQELEDGMLYAGKNTKRGGKIPARECESARGADYYKGRFNKTSNKE